MLDRIVGVAGARWLRGHADHSPPRRQVTRARWGLLRGLAALAAFTLAPAAARAQVASKDGSFLTLPQAPEVVLAGEGWVRPKVYQSVLIDTARLAGTLAQAPLEDTPAAQQPLEIELPMPDGGFAAFAVVESPIMEPALAAQFPQIKTYWAQGLDDPHATARLDLTPAGFHAQILSPRGAVYVDPLTRGDTAHYAVYFKADLGDRDDGWRCEFGDEHRLHRFAQQHLVGHGASAQRAGATRRTFRLAVAATAEYTAFHGGTVAAGQGAIVTLVNRVNGIYETELAVRLTLVANNSVLVFTDAATDPYSNGSTSTMLSQNQSTVDSLIGAANYDIGHVVGTGTGGVALLGAVCGAGVKAQGVSSLTSPVGDPFAVDYVAHEMGHQFNAEHTWNGSGGSCSSGARNNATAMEPGSGSTIMAYAGICGTNNLQNNSDPFFHSVSFDEIIAFVATACGAPAATGNTAPTVSAGADFTIPASTPFTLTAAGSDPNGDALTYSWEQRNTGTGQAPVSGAFPDTGANPIIRAFPPTSSPSRTIPRLSNLLNNTFVFGEALPTTTRTLNFRVTARDNRAGNGGVNTDDMVVSVVNTGSPFRVTSPNTSVLWSGQRTVTWDVAGTAAAPINAASVRILLSTDGGNTFPTVLNAGTANDGSENVTLPNITASSARIRVEPVGNIFFDISDTVFSITPAPVTPVFALAAAPAVLDSASFGSGNGNARLDPGESGIGLAFTLVNTGSQSATGVSVTLESLTATAGVTTPTQVYPNLASSQSAASAEPFIIALSPLHPCGDPVSLRLTVSCNQTTPQIINTSITTGIPGGSATSTFAYSGPALSIPDANATGVTASLSVPAGLGAITDVNFRFDGTACSATAGATGNGLTHSYVGDLVITLISPAGTQVRLLDRAGPGGSGTSGNNLCQTLLDDDVAALNIDAITASLAPFTGTWIPQNPLSAFDGQSPTGTWQLRVVDLGTDDLGTLRAFSLILSTLAPPLCDPPALTCAADFNADKTVNDDDLSEFITAYFNALPGPGGFASPPCPGLDAPFDTEGYRADFNLDCSLNDDDLGEYLTAYFTPCE